MLQDLQKLSTTKVMTTKHPLLDRWVRVLMSIAPNSKVPNIHTATTRNMSVTTLEKLKMADPELYQTVFARPIEEIEDGRLQQHLYDQKFWTDDEDALRENGYVKTILGRKRFLKDINSRNGMIRSSAERNAINTPVQGSAADIIKLSMIKINDVFKKNSLESKLILQVHDELIFDTPINELEIAKKLIKKNMENAYELKVPLTVDLGVGENWLEAH